MDEIFQRVRSWFQPVTMDEIFQRVRSWLRMNAGGVPNTCKSSGEVAEIQSMICFFLAADG